MKLNGKSAATFAVVCGLSLAAIAPQAALADEVTEEFNSDGTIIEKGESNTQLSVEEATENLEKAEAEVEDKQDQVDEAQEAVDNHESSEDIQADIDAIEDNIEKREEVVDEAQSTLEDKQGRLDEALEQKDNQEKVIADLTDEKKQTEEDLANAQATSKDSITKAQEASDKQAKEVAFQEGKVERAQAALDTAKDLLQQELDKKKEAEERRAKLTEAGDIAQIDAQLAVINHKIDSYQEVVDDAKADLESHKERLQVAIDKKNKAQKALDGLIEQQNSIKDMGLSVIHEEHLVGNILQNSSFVNKVKITFTLNGTTQEAVRVEQSWQTVQNKISYYVDPQTGRLNFKTPQFAQHYDGSKVEVSCDGYKTLTYTFKHLGGYRWMLEPGETINPIQDLIDAAKKKLAAAEKDVEFAQGKVDRAEAFLNTSEDTLNKEIAKKESLEKTKQDILDVDAVIAQLDNNIDARQEVVDDAQADLDARQQRLDDAKAKKDALDAELARLIEEGENQQTDLESKISDLEEKLAEAQAKLESIEKDIEYKEGRVERAEESVKIAEDLLNKDIATKEELQTKLDEAKSLEAALEEAKKQLADAIKNRDEAAIALEIAKDAQKPEQPEIIDGTDSTDGDQANKPTIKPGSDQKKKVSPSRNTSTPQTSDASWVSQIPAVLGLGIASLGAAKRRRK